MRAGGCLFTAIALTALQKTDAALPATIETNYGPVVGKLREDDSGVTEFHAIPFASPPVGDLRYALDFTPPIVQN